MNLGVIMLIIFAILIGVAVVVVQNTLKKLNGEEKGIQVDTKNIKTAQRFLPWDEISNNALYLGGFKYRAFIECSSTNYALKTEDDKEITEMAFKQFLNSIQFPLSIYIQTREINYGEILLEMEKDIDTMDSKYPQLSEYSKSYYNEIKNLKDTIESSKQKKKYIIVPFEDAIEMSELGPTEKESYSQKELDSRVSMICDNLQSVGIIGRRLSTEDIIDLMFSVYHRDEDSVNGLLSGGAYTTDIVSGKNNAKAQESLAKAIMILNRAEQEFNLGVISNNNPYQANELFSSISDEISTFKKALTTVSENGGIKSLATDEELFDKFDKNGLLIQTEDTSIGKINSIKEAE